MSDIPGPSTLPQRSLGEAVLTASLPLPPPPLAPVGLLFCAVPLECCTAGTCPSITVLRYSALSRYSLNCNATARPVVTPVRAVSPGAHQAECRTNSGAAPFAQDMCCCMLGCVPSSFSPEACRCRQTVI